MEEFFDKLEESILVINGDGNIEFCNKQLLSNLNYTYEEVQYQPIDKLLKQETKYLKQYAKYKGQPIDLKFYNKLKKEVILKSQILVKEWNGRRALFVLSQPIKNEVDKTLESLLDQIPYSVWIKDRQGRYCYINQIAIDYIGKFEKEIKKEDIIGKTDKEFWQKVNIVKAASTDEYVTKNKMSLMYEEVKDDESGQLWFQTYKVPILDHLQEVAYIGGIKRNITLNKNIEHELSKSNHEITLLNSIIKQEDNHEEPYKVLKNIRVDVMRQLEADGLTILTYDDEKQTLNVQIRYGEEENPLGEFKKIKVSSKDMQRIYMDDNYWGIKPIEDEETTCYKEVVDGSEIRYIGKYPIAYKGELLGMLIFYYKSNSIGMFKKDTFIKSICDQLAILIKNENLSKDIKDELLRRKITETELECFLDTSADMMAILDKAGNFKKVTSGWTKALGWSEKEIVGRKWQDLIHPEDTEVMMTAFEASIISNSVKRSVARYRCKDGAYKWLEWKGKCETEAKIIYSSVRDVTEYRRLKEKEEIYERSLQVDKIKNDFFSNMSHEFRTPLNIILTMMQLLERMLKDKSIQCSDEEKLWKYSNTVKKNSYRLLRLVNNVIDMTRLDTGHYALRLGNHDIVTIIEDITMSVVDYIKQESIEIVFDTEEEEIILACDPKEIERIMLNLLSNAFKAIGEKGKISVNLKVNDDKLLVSIKDTGEGIAKPKLKAIFNRFIQADYILTRRSEGSGLGLSLVKALVELHNGRVWIESEINKGTEAFFEIPIRQIEESEEKIDISTSINKVEKCKIEFSDIYSI